MDAVPPHPGSPSVWDTVRVDFPFADRAEVRRRPALVVAVAHVHADFSVLWLAMITSASGGSWPFDVPVSDLRSGGLLRPCVVRISKVASVDARLAGWIGTLASADRRAVAAILRDVLKPVLTL
jgi:mRNA-degrading endonuclease toxin of MazEF toxin-antitoxin module